MGTALPRASSMCRLVATAAMVAGLVSVSPANAQAVALSPCEPSDHGYPTVTSLAFEPARVDVRREGATVRVVATATDVGGPGPATGVESIWMDVVGLSVGGPFLTLRPATDGTFTGTFRVPRGVAGGNWSAMSLIVTDKASNERRYEEAARDFPQASVEIRSVADRARPRIESFTLSRSTADTRNGPVRVRLRATLTDDVGLPSRFAVHGDAESSSDAVTTLPRDSKSYWLRRVSGGPRHGVWAATVVMKRWDRPGPWFFGLDVVDRSGRWTALDRSDVPMPPFRLVAAKDRDEPRAADLSSSSTLLDVRSGASSVTVSVRLRDRTSGIGAAGVSSASSALSPTEPMIGSRLRLVSGDRHDGVWRGTVQVPRCGTPPGNLRLRLRAIDRAGHDLAQPAGITVQVVNSDTVDPRAALQVPVENGVLKVSFDEPVTGLSSSTAVVSGTSEEDDPFVIRGSWACKDIAGQSTDCASGAVLTATFTVEAGQPDPEYGYRVELNPEGTLGLTDLAGNAPRSAVAVPS